MQEFHVTLEKYAAHGRHPLTRVFRLTAAMQRQLLVTRRALSKKSMAWRGLTRL